MEVQNSVTDNSNTNDIVETADAVATVTASNRNPDVVYTNSLTMQKVCDLQLTTTRENNSIFIQYDSHMEKSLGCEFTFKRKCKEYDRYECKFCRKLVDKAKKTSKVPEDQEPALLRVVNRKVVDFIKEKHKNLCCIEPLATAYARSENNVCVQHKGKYGGTAKQAYDAHSKKLLKTSPDLNVTVCDIVAGFKTFDAAKGALNKSSNRKSAVAVHNEYRWHN